MPEMPEYSIGVGDRFAHQATAQLRACQQAMLRGAKVIPVWNKSHREHTTVGSEPASVRAAADAAVRELGWNLPYFVDADHIRLDTVDAFLPCSDFFTIDVAHAIGRLPERQALQAFVARHPELIGRQEIPGAESVRETTRSDVEAVAAKYLLAVQEAGRIYRHIRAAKGADSFHTEVSIDETDAPQTPDELLVILAALADEGIPVRTVAPKFTGRFNKGVDYEGNIARFDREFREDLAVIAFAVQRYPLPQDLKLSVHSGSDKFSLYEPIRKALADFRAGVHLKTAGTTWLEEVIGIAETGGSGLEMAKEIYAQALGRREALCAPYASVISIDPDRLPSVEAMAGWSAEEFVAALRHDPGCSAYNPNLRQLIHVGYKIAAQMGPRYVEMLAACAETVARNVTTNLYARHIRPLFLEGGDKEIETSASNEVAG